MVLFCCLVCSIKVYLISACRGTLKVRVKERACNGLGAMLMEWNAHVKEMACNSERTVKGV